LFTNAHSQAPLCGPSRSSIMTGLRPSTTGIYGHIEDDDLKKAHPKTKASTLLPEYFRDHGYYTMGIGKIFHKHAPTNSFDESGGRYNGFGPKPEDGSYFKWRKGGTSTDWGAYPSTDKEMPDYASAKWAIERLNREYDQPFFLAVGFLRPHVPWYVPQKWFDMHDPSKIVTPPYLADDFNDIPDISRQLHEVPVMPTTEWAIENGEWEKIIQGYSASVTFVDYYVGEILKALNNSEYKDNTIVIIWSDHGYRLGEKGLFAKHSLWQESTKVPLIFAGNGLKSNIKIDQPVELLDIYPTLLDLCGLPQNDQLEGSSLSPVMENPKLDLKKSAITTYGWNNHAIVFGDYRYIHYEDGSEELYNHKNDPNEFYNIAADNQNSKIINHLKSFLPKTNEKWAELSKHDVNDYMTQQRLDQLNN
jgi:iduronate 2-sulfatase